MDKSLVLEDFDDSITHKEDEEFDNNNHKQGYEGSFSSGSFSQDPTDDVDDDNVANDDSTDVDDNDDGINLETVTEEDEHKDEHEGIEDKWYYKAKFMLDWVNKFLCLYCLHPGFALSIDEMMKLFKG